MKFKVIRWDQKPESTRFIELACPHCGCDADLEVGEFPGAIVIAALGLSLIFDPAGYIPPHESMPQEIKCPKCRRIFGEPDVR